MGTVYLAEQHEPVQRRVAVKLIKLGMDSKAVVLRFRQEEQALALMQHDGIAKVFDCGTTDRGQPYFVMEYVKGIPLTDYCDQHRLSLPNRLQLFRQVCAAVQHAHLKGVVHRDLKPGNVLVVDEGGERLPKIIDFGIAKSMGQRLVEATMFTEAGQVVGTPEYMSPEQSDPTNADIDTRADVYSLGVMLYELLVGALPFSREQLRKAGMLEVQRVLRDVEPPRPSTRLTSAGDTSMAIASARRMSFGALQRALKNDLDWVVLKAMEKDRSRRYDTANALAADLQRFLDHEPLAAGPPSAVYRLKKLVRKYRQQALVAALVFVAVVAGGTVSYFEYLRADEQAGIALRNQRTAERQTLAAEASSERASKKTVEAQLSAERAKLAEALAETKTQEAERSLVLAEQHRQRAEAATQVAEEATKRAESALARFNMLAHRVQLDAAVAMAQTLFPPVPENAPKLQTWLTDRAEPLMSALPRLEAQLAELERAVLPTVSTGSVLAPESGLFLLHAVRDLVQDLRRFTSPEGVVVDVRERLEWARTVYKASIENYALPWRDCLATIRRETGIEMPPQVGLVPLGKDPKSALWEFADLRSGDRLDAVPPRDAATGKLRLTCDHGIVFVLIPGGEFIMGAQKESAAQPNFDELAEDNEHPNHVSLSPFFLGKHEVTQAQWKRLTRGGEPSASRAGSRMPDGHWITWSNPVENVDLLTAEQVLASAGLILPTEAQWEFACKASTTTPWFPGSSPADLAGYCNLADETARLKAINWGRFERFNDEYLVHAPIGTFLPNIFGLHDMHGNVTEWCRDGLSDYLQTPARAGDGLRSMQTTQQRIARGGSFKDVADMVRSAFRHHLPGAYRAQDVGLRASRAICTGKVK